MTLTIIAFVYSIFSLCFSIYAYISTQHLYKSLDDISRQFDAKKERLRAYKIDSVIIKIPDTKK